MLAQRLAAFLESRGVDCALIGGVALAVHGVARATIDADLLVADARVLDLRFWDGAGLGTPDIRIGMPKDPLAGLVRLESPEGRVDVLLIRGAWVGPILDRRIRVEVAGASLPVARAADLVLLKLAAGGPQDLLDVRLLLAGLPGLAAEVAPWTGALPREARKIWARLTSGGSAR